MAKKALLVGLNHYPDPGNSLRGCLNDVAQVHALAMSRLHFEERDIVTLTDSRATTRNIVNRLHWLIDGAAVGDVLLFHYSGHGSQVDDADGDETDDRMDEIICPYDLDWGNPFTDDDLYAIVKDLPPGVNLTVVLDCCHSGTGLREPGREPPHGSEKRSQARFMEPPRPPGAGRLRLQALRRFGARATQRGAILIAACRSDQVAADAFIDRDYHGALTYYLCQALEEAACAGSYSSLIRRVRRLLAMNGYDQVPQLEGPAALLRHDVFAPAVEFAGS
jgi:metacaspase-1